MKAILFVSALFISSNSYAATVPDALTLNGLTWGQVVTTSNFYLPDMYDACGVSGGECSGTVNGVDLSGWRWANQSEVDSLISDFFGIEYKNDFSNIPNSVHLNTKAWFDYFSPTAHESTSYATIGFSSDVLVEVDGWIDFSQKASNTTVEYDPYDNTGLIHDFFPYWHRGDSAFGQDPLYYSGYYLVKGDYLPPSPVPVPAALYLFAPALLGFLGFRRKLS